MSSNENRMESESNVNQETNARRNESNERMNREVAWRVFAREFNDSDYSFREGEDERAPNYVVTPTGAKINRLFVVGVATEVENIGENDDLYRARISDPTGTFLVYAGQYQPEAMTFLAELETPEFVAVVGKARTYEPEESDEVYTSIRPEEVNKVGPDTRDRWTVQTASQTLERIELMRKALSGESVGEEDDSPPGVVDGVGRAIEHYGTGADYLSDLKSVVVEALESVTDGDLEIETDVKLDDVAEEVETVDDELTEVEDRGESEKESRSESEDEEKTEVESEVKDIDKTTEGETKDGSDEVETTTGDFDLGELEDVESEEVTDADVEEPEEAEWEWDEDQREEVEEKFGAEFETGSEVRESEEDEESEVEDVVEDEIEETEDEIEETEDEESEVEDVVKDEIEETEVEDAESDDTDQTAEVDDPEGLIMEIIEEGPEDGVERSEIIERATESGVDEDEAEDTLEDLLMAGMCYPTDGDRIKPL